MDKAKQQKTVIGVSDLKIPVPSVKDMLEAGVHFGHETQRWEPHFREYIYTKKGGFHIIDLEKTEINLQNALQFLQKLAGEGDIIIVGTKRQARDIVKEEAIRCGAHFIINRWIGGLITNFDTVRKGIERLNNLEGKLSRDMKLFTQQELSVMRKEWGRLERLYGGIKSLQRLPKALVVIDAHYEKLAIKEAQLSKIPIVAIIDTNTDPFNIDYPIPGNDDAIKSIQLFVHTFADAILSGNKGNGVKYEYKDLSRVGIK